VEGDEVHEGEDVDIDWMLLFSVCAQKLIDLILVIIVTKRIVAKDFSIFQ